MKALIQRVARASVAVEGTTVASIGRGLVALIGVKHGDSPSDARLLASKTGSLRIFPDEKGKMNLSVQDIGGSVLAVPQFTLYADTRRGNRPGFSDAALPETAQPLYEEYVAHLRKVLNDERVACGVFRASMVVEIINEGPVTIELSTDYPNRV